MNDTSAQLRREALREASEWFLRLQQDDLTDADLEDWGRWMAASPHHASAFDDVAALWDASAALDSAAILHARERSTARPNVASAVNAFSASAHARRRRRWPRWLASGMAASLVVAASAWFMVTRQAPLGEQQVLATGIGERRHITLADGSMVDMDAATEMIVRFDRDRRDLELRTGQAFFVVAHAPERPFVVTAGNVQSRALGTRFAMTHRANHGVAVTVAEGRVRVGAMRAQNTDAQHFDAVSGQQVTFSPSTGLQAPREVNALMATAWREGAVVYQGETLENVIDDLNRYSRVPVRLQDPALGQLKVTGRWELTGIDRWVDGLAGALRMKVTRKTDGILLSRDDRQKDGAD